MKYARKHFAQLLIVFALIGSLGCSGDSNSTTVFEVIIENIASDTALPRSDGGFSLVVFSPSVFAIHDQGNPFFALGQPAPDNGLEAYAEDGDSSGLLEFLGFADGVSLRGIANSIQPNGSAAVLTPGQQYRAVFNADNNASKLSLLLQFFQANDLFVANVNDGIPLFDAAGNPVTGDVTASFGLLDAGTEVNEFPGEGASQTVSQTEPNTGASESGVVAGVNDGFTYPPVNAVLRITINVVDVVD